MAKTIFQNKTLNFLKQKIFLAARPLAQRYFVFLHKKQSNFLKIPVPAITLSFDCDLERDSLMLLAVAEVLRKYNFPASFAGIGFWIEKHPEIYKKLLLEGHEIINHTYSHPDNIEINLREKFLELSKEKMAQEIIRCDRVCREILNYQPRGFRAPHFGESFSYDFFPVLKELGYQYDSSTIDWRVNKSGEPFQVQGLWEIPMTCFPSAPFTLMDTWTAFHSDLHVLAETFLEEFKILCRLCFKHKWYLSIYLDPADAIGYQLLEPMAQILKENQIQVITYKQIFQK